MSLHKIAPARRPSPCSTAADDRKVAALFVETNGCYFNLPGVDPWDIERDARKYSGPHPVVAHPPCQLWGRFAHVNYARWGGAHNHPGNDGGCFASALASVREWGGVLEHPAFSDAWSAYSLTEPTGIGWHQCAESEWTCEVWQSAYKHKANKRTWLYYVGPRPVELLWDRPTGTHQIGFHDKRGKDRNKPTISGKAASATPPAFRDALLSLASNSVMGEKP
jgi:hypothetical protein